MAHGQLCMTKEMLREGFAKGRSCIQEEWAHPLEKQWIEELIAEGACTTTEWEYKDNFQCSMRRVTGIRE